MKLYAIGGFFGSGKTTLILRLARWLCLEKKQRIVIVQNEIGKVGIDDQLLKAAGLEVNSLMGGCICCNMQTGLVSTLGKIAAEDRADAVILEATGMAAPRMLVQLLCAPALPPMERRFLFLLDLARIQKLKNWFSMPYAEAYLQSGGIVVANKVDTVTDEFRHAFRARAREVAPDAMLVEVSLAADGELPDALRFMLDDDSVELPHHCKDPCDHDTHHGHGAGHSHEHGEHPTVCVRQRDVVAGEGFPKAVEKLLDGIARSATASGGFIAHIKTFVQDARGICAGCSVTRLDETPRWSADPRLLSGPAILTVNAIVFGVGERELSSLVDAGLCHLEAAQQAGS